jgi:hypothetical protein
MLTAWLCTTYEVLVSTTYFSTKCFLFAEILPEDSYY